MFCQGEKMNRKEWLEWRKQGIGASDVPAIMGTSPFKTAFELWQEKISLEIKEDDSSFFIMDAGNDAETKVRAFYELITGIEYPVALCQMEQLPYMRCSLDGRSGPEIIEIKLLGDGGKKAKPEHMKWTNAKNQGVVPAWYNDQVQAAILVSGASTCTFLAYKYDAGDKYLKKQLSRENLAIVKVLPDPKRQAEILEACAKFYQCMVDKKPPQLSDGDYKKLCVKGAKSLIQSWKRNKLKLERLEADQDAIRATVLGMVTGHPRWICDGVEIAQVAGRQGSIDYKQIVERQDVQQILQVHGKVDLEPYRGKQGQSSWRMTARK